MQSPFIYNNPVIGNDFFNRKDLIEFIVNYTCRRKDMGNIWLVGQRQVGKTSILKYVEQLNKTFNCKTHDGKTVKFIYIDCQSIKKKRRNIG